MRFLAVGIIVLFMAGWGIWGLFVNLLLGLVALSATAVAVSALWWDVTMVRLPSRFFDESWEPPSASWPATGPAAATVLSIAFTGAFMGLMLSRDSIGLTVMVWAGMGLVSWMFATMEFTDAFAPHPKVVVAGFMIPVTVAAASLPLVASEFSLLRSIMPFPFSLLAAAAGGLYAAHIGRRVYRTETLLPGPETTPPFRLRDLNGTEYTLDSFRDKRILVVTFWSTRCQSVDAWAERVLSAERRYRSKGVQFILINPEPERAPGEIERRMAERARRAGYEMPYLRDAERLVAMAFEASTMPEFYVYDESRRLRYRGRFDNSRDPTRARRHYLPDALDALLMGRSPRLKFIPARGCLIPSVETEPET